MGRRNRLRAHLRHFRAQVPARPQLLPLPRISTLFQVQVQAETLAQLLTQALLQRPTLAALLALVLVLTVTLHYRQARYQRQFPPQPSLQVLTRLLLIQYQTLVLLQVLAQTLALLLAQALVLTVALHYLQAR